MKPMLWLIAAMLVSIALIGNCERVEQEQLRDVARVSESMIFFREPRSGLCFALARPHEDRKTHLLAQVPCEAVDHLIVK